MKDLIVRLCRWGLTVLGVNAAISCDNNIEVAPMYGVPVVEYGSPFMEYRIKGQVVSSNSGDPIKGIAVTYINEATKQESKDTVWTTSNGEFECHGTDFPTESIILKFTDVDGVENIAEFDSKSVRMALKKVEDGDGRWNMGVFTTDDLNITLLPTELFGVVPPITLAYGTQYDEYVEKSNAEKR